MKTFFSLIFLCTLNIVTVNAVIFDDEDTMVEAHKKITQWFLFVNDGE